MVYQMRSGNWFGINCGKAKPDFKQFSNDSFSTSIMFDYTESRKHENYFKITKPDERHMGDGVINGKFEMNEKYMIVVISQSDEPEVVASILNSLPNPDKWSKFIIQ